MSLKGFETIPHTRDAAAARLPLMERVAGHTSLVGFLIYAMAAPHSIAGAWMGLGLAVLGWLLRTLATGRTGVRRTTLDLPLWLLFFWTVLSAFASYEPRVSLAKLISVSIFLIYYLTESILARRAAVLLACVMILSGVAGVAQSIIEIVRGRGVIIEEVAESSPLGALETPLQKGDAVWRAGGRRIDSVEELDAQLRRAPVGERLSLSVISRGEHVELPGPLVSDEMKSLASPSGVSGNRRMHNFRASGWTRHYETFAEMLQIVAQLALGFSLAAWQRRERQRSSSSSTEARSPTRRSFAVIFFVAFILLGVGLALTAMRTVLVAFGIGACFVAWRAVSGRARLLVLTTVVLALALGAFAVWRTRSTGAITLSDASAALRFEVARVAFERTWQHPLLGHGMDAVHRHWNEWGFPGRDMLHAHSTPLQIAFDRGIPALLLWFWIVVDVWRRTSGAERMWRETDEWGAHGLTLGTTGALAGLVASSLVNYNFGDAEVALLFWWLAGAAVVLSHGRVEKSG